MASTQDTRLLKFKGHEQFRHRLVLSLLSRRPVRIDEIRSDDEDPGLKEFEVSFLRLLEKITTGTEVEISFTGTSLYFSPGTLTGGNSSHTCPTSRSIGWFLEPLLAVAPFGKTNLSLTLRGITTDGHDASADVLRTSCLPYLSLFLENPEGLELRIVKRGHLPQGGGEVHFSCPAVRTLKPTFEFIVPGRVQKIRGIAHSVRMSPQTSNRLVSAARGVLNRYIPDIYIYTDAYKGEESGKSPGYALTLVATTTTTTIYSAEGVSVPPKQIQSEQTTPEDVAVVAARQLLEEISRGGCVDRGIEWLVCLMMALGSEDVRKVRLGVMDPKMVQFLRDLNSFFGSAFKIRPAETDKERGEWILSCVGIGYVNYSKKMT